LPRCCREASGARLKKESWELVIQPVMKAFGFSIFDDEHNDRGHPTMDLACALAITIYKRITPCKDSQD
jgi:hypothetical protein